MNCIFICIFKNKHHIDLLYLLLESLYIFGNLRDDTEILIYTSNEFMKIIENSNWFTSKIRFEINDTYHDVDKSCKSRLDLFNLQSSSKYDKFLYLDTDILITQFEPEMDINVVFDIAMDDLLYTVEEGQIGNIEEYYGRSLFGDEIDDYEDKSAFSSGILLFKNCEKIKQLFYQINECIKIRGNESNYYDQPFIVYNAFKYKLFDNQKLKQFAINQHTNFNLEFLTGMVINHFPGDPTGSKIEIKINIMQTVLNSLKHIMTLKIIEYAKTYIDQNLMPIINQIGEPLEGNIFTEHQSINYTYVFFNKVMNISSLLLNKQIKNVMEIGFNSGFSTLLMLLSNSNVKITCFDLGEHKYTLPCYEKLKETFGNRLNLIIGDNTQTLQTVNDKYDLIHIDGGHSTEVAESDIINSARLSKKGTIIIMDNYNFPNLHDLWNNYVRIYNLTTPNIQIHSSPHHDIKYFHYTM